MLAQITNAVPDLAKFVHDVAPSLSYDQIVALIGSLVVIARILRKAIPDTKQTGTVGTILKHAALEINPPTASNPLPESPVEIQATSPTPK